MLENQQNICQKCQKTKDECLCAKNYPNDPRIQEAIKRLKNLKFNNSQEITKNNQIAPKKTNDRQR